MKNVPQGWRLEETLLLFELVERDAEWSMRAAKLVETFGGERPVGFFTEKSCKEEFERVMSSGHPEHFLRKQGEKYSQKELVHAWTVYLQKEQAIKRAREEELLLVKLRQKADLFNRLFSHDSNFTDDEIERLLEKAREEDAMRDQEAVEKELETAVPKLKELQELHEADPQRYPPLKIIIPPSHPLEPSINTTPFSPIKPLFEGLPIPAQKASDVSITTGSVLSRNVSSPQRNDASLAVEVLVDSEKPPSTRTRLRTLWTNSRASASVGNNALSSRPEISGSFENLTSHLETSKLISRPPTESGADGIESVASETFDEAKLHCDEGRNEVNEEVPGKKEPLRTKRAAKTLTRSLASPSNVDNETTAPVQHEHSSKIRRSSAASPQRTLSGTKVPIIVEEGQNNAEEEEGDEGKLRRSERHHGKTDLETNNTAIPTQTLRRKRTAKVEMGSNEDEGKASSSKRRRLSSRNAESVEKKDTKYQIESNIEVQSSPEPEKEEKRELKELNEQKAFLDLPNRNRTSRIAVAVDEKSKEKTGTSSEIPSIRSPRRGAVAGRSSRQQSKRGSSADGDIEQKALMVTALRMVSSHRHAAIFAHPVSDRDARGYSKTVKSRMDLSTLKKLLDSGNLSGMGGFKRNVLLMFANAVMFNSTGHDVNQYAKEMAADTLGSLKMLQKDVLLVRGTAHMTRRSAAFAAEEAKFERSRFSSPRATPTSSDEPSKEKTSGNASRETSEIPKTTRGGRASKE